MSKESSIDTVLVTEGFRTVLLFDEIAPLDVLIDEDVELAEVVDDIDSLCFV